ncbi:thialysine N-epsilon-acetyltransferase-like [Latimeria chalumnae]|uniref:thialysine N-epsilon-acetyltransferase-like n=1 Tax=Latimeria chalumnae TaxID=7897 RepID=UPI00313AC037
MDFTVRAAKPEDCTDIMRMIRELAKYEKLPEQVKINEEVLREDGFSERPWFKCLVVEIPQPCKNKEGHAIVGYALYYFTYGTWTGRNIFLEDLYVMPDYRGKGMGKELMRRVAEELAGYMKLPEQVKINEEVLREDGFSERPWFKCLVVEIPQPCKNKEGHTIVGYALYYFTYETWTGRNIFLEELYVMPDYRGKGMGKELMRRVAEVGVESKCARLRLAVVNWNKSAIDFYRGHGATDLTVQYGWHLFRFDTEAMQKFALGQSKS